MAHLQFTPPTTVKPKRKNNRLRQKEYSILQSQQHNNGIDVTTENPVIADMNSKKEVTIIEIHNEDDYTDEKSESERKYIIPLALKNPTPEPRKSQLFQDSSTNIDDLKRHILMLQNLTKNDQSFQSKFVVFPSLQRNQSASTTTTETPTQPTTTTRRPLFMSRISSMRDSFADVLSNVEFHRLEKITIVPQVFLQNDQMLMNDDSFETPRNEERVKPPIKARETRRKNYRNRLSPEELAIMKKQPQRRTTSTTTTTTTTLATTTSTTTTTRKPTVLPQRKTPVRRRNDNSKNKQSREQRRNRNAQRKQECREGRCNKSVNKSTDGVENIGAVVNMEGERKVSYCES